jgi:hypothetical protein
MSKARGRLEQQMADAVREHLRSGKDPILPEAGGLFWRIFAELCGSRHGREPVTYAEIEAWARLNRWPLCSHHVAILKAMDRAWLLHGEGSSDAIRTTTPAQKISPELFDAVFA